MSLAAFRGAPLVIAFYPADFTPVCSSELAILNELRPEIGELGARAVGISTDAIWSHIAFARELGLQLPLLSDYHPKGDVSGRYRVYREQDGFSERALYVIDGDGTVVYGHVSPIEVNPGLDGVLDALERLAGRGIEPASRPPTPAVTL
jgi:peroxiredoxin (alkyl hydroperoxide reductase subunit C)